MPLGQNIVDGENIKSEYEIRDTSVRRLRKNKAYWRMRASFSFILSHVRCMTKFSTEVDLTDIVWLDGE